MFIAAASVELVLADLYSLLLKYVLSSSQADPGAEVPVIKHEEYKMRNSRGTRQL